MGSLKFSLETQEKSRDLYRLLIANDRPKTGNTLTYTEAAKQIGMLHHRPLKFPLELIQDACTERPCPNLTVLIVRKGERLPGDGCNDGEADAFRQMLMRIGDYDWPTAPWW